MKIWSSDTMLKLMKDQTHNAQESPACKHLSQKERSKSYEGLNSHIHRWDILDEQKDKLLLSKVNELQRAINPNKGDQQNLKGRTPKGKYPNLHDNN